MKQVGNFNPAFTAEAFGLKHLKGVSYNLDAPLLYEAAIRGGEAEIAHAIQRLYELTRDRKAFITTEVGQHQMWAAQFYGFQEPNRWMTSGGLGTMRLVHMVPE